MSCEQTTQDRKYTVKIIPAAKKEWDGLQVVVKNFLKKKLAQRALMPRSPSWQLKGMEDCYKIKFRRAGIRAVYQVIDDEIIIVVWAINRRDKKAVYAIVQNRLKRFESSQAMELDISS